MPKYDYITMPNKLPEKPEGFTTSLVMHLNFGGMKGAAAYQVKDPAGREMPFSFVYNTQERIRGFALPGVKPILTWKELCQTWPLWIQRARKKQLEKMP